MPGQSTLDAARVHQQAKTLLEQFDQVGRPQTWLLVQLFEQEADDLGGQLVGGARPWPGGQQAWAA